MPIVIFLTGIVASDLTLLKSAKTHRPRFLTGTAPLIS